MKSKLILICTIFTMAITSVGCSAEKTFKDTETSYEMKYDGTVWKAAKDVEIEGDYGTYTYSGVFTTKAKTEDGDPAATLKVLREDLSEFSYSEETVLDDIAGKLAVRVPNGIVTYQDVTIAGLKGYWIANTPMDEGDPITDLIFFVTDDSVYEFYYTAVGDENYALYENGENGVNYMLYYFSLL